MKYTGLRTMSIWMLILVSCILSVGMMGIAAAGEPIAAISATWVSVIGIGLGVARAAGHPDMGSASNLNIPEIWAQEAREKLNAQTCLTEITAPNPIGADKIKQMGDKIHIPTLASVPNYAYSKGDTFEIDFLESPSVTMEVDKARRFAFGIEAVDAKQMNIKDWMGKYSNQANIDLKKAIETEFFGSVYSDFDATNQGIAAGAISGNINLGATGTPITLSSTNVIRKILDAGQCLVENNIPLDDNWWMVIPAAMATIIKDSELKVASLTGDRLSILRNKGFLGQIDRFNLFTSNLLDIDTSTSNYHILFGHRSALWFVTQFAQVKQFDPPNAFVDSALKGLNVYGYGVLQPAAVGQMVANISLT